MASNNHAPRNLAGLSLRLHELAIHTGDLKHSCLGCGHEHNCGRLASGVETRFDYCPWCGARMDGDAE